MQQRVQIGADAWRVFVLIADAEAAAKVDVVQFDTMLGQLIGECQQFVECFGKRGGVKQL